jgi:glycosyltransferase involved in cell wall biosynthesis
MNIVILTCVYNDWTAAQALLPLLDAELLDAGLDAEVLIVDDGTTDPPPDPPPPGSFAALRVIRVLQLRKNLGHQRAIAVGLAYIYDRLPCDAVVVMDADGEDRPADVVRLVRALAELPTPAIVFAERSRRSESLPFIVFYHAYRLLHFILTGRGVRVGNFSVVPYSLLAGLVVDLNLWNHYAASVYVSKARTATIPTQRGRRLHGRSRFGFVSLVIHGLSAISCYNEIVSVRLLIYTAVAALALLVSLAATVAVRLFTDLAIPGWATYAAGILTIILMQVLLFTLIVATTLLGDRTHQPVLPLRDYSYFVGRLRDFYRHGF